MDFYTLRDPRDAFLVNSFSLARCPVMVYESLDLTGTRFARFAFELRFALFALSSTLKCLPMRVHPRSEALEGGGPHAHWEKPHSVNKGFTICVCVSGSQADGCRLAGVLVPP